MCGIAGVVAAGGNQPQARLVTAMCDALAHRGPDAEGFWTNDGIALGHRRLSILDLSTGAQPLSNEDGSITIVYNGEVYNFAELRAACLGRGHVFKTCSDTEVIVHLYEDFGADCLHHLRGMFAFAIWDDRLKRLLLARDRVGKKPLFFARTPTGFAFASELHSLLQNPDVPREVDPAAIDEYLTYGYIAAPRTIFHGVRKLLPAHYLCVDAHQLAAAEPIQVRYWTLAYVPKLIITDDEAEERLLEHLRDAVRIRMVADVPVGALLSGGIDSSLVVALMSECAESPVRTFSIGFDESAYNELPYARAVAERYATDHHELIVKPAAADVLPKLVRHYGEPFADSSAVPSYYVAQMTGQHVKVALNGDGGDECLGGYDRYRGSALAEHYKRLPGWLRGGLLEPLSALIPDTLSPRNRLRQAKRFLANAGRSSGERYLRWMTYFTPEDKATLYSPDFKARLGVNQPEAWLRELVERDRGDELDRLLAADVDSYLPYDLLVKMDIASMANSLETRSPFLDQEVMEFTARLPSRLKIRGTQGKFLSHRLARHFMPPQARNRRKMGFGVPVAEWLRRELRPMLEDLLLSPRAASRGLFDPEAVRALAERHWAGQDHSFKLWSLLWLELWYREILDGSDGPPSSILIQTSGVS